MLALCCANKLKTRAPSASSALIFRIWLSAACVCVIILISLECESLEMQTGPYVAQWPDRPAPRPHNLSSTYTSQPCKFPVCSQIMLSELITPPTSPPTPHFTPMASPHMLGHRFSSISWDLESKGNRDAEQASCDPHVCLSWPDRHTDGLQHYSSSPPHPDSISHRLAAPIHGMTSIFPPSLPRTLVLIGADVILDIFSEIRGLKLRGRLALPRHVVPA